MNNQEENYNFCPRCGALMEDGICPECSKNREQGVYSSQNFPKEPPQDHDQAGGGYSQQDWQYDRQEQYYEQQQPDPYRNQQYGQQGPYYGQQGPYQGQQGPYYGGQNPYQGQQGPYYGGQNPYQGQKNPYYGQPGPYPGQNYGPYQPYNPFMKPKKDNRVAIAIGVVAAVLVLLVLIILSYFYGYFLTKMANENMGSPAWEEYYDYYGDNDSTGRDGDDGYGGGSYDDYDEDDYDYDYVPSPDDTYYYGPCDAVNEDVEYSFVTKSYTNEDPDNDIDVVVNYLEIKGDTIPNVDRLNEAIEDVALYYAVDFPQYSYYAEYGERFAVYTTAYVTYNDEDMISIVLDEYVIVDDEYHVDLYPINIDVKNGVVLDNGSLLRIDEEFAREFRERNDEQNGSIDYLDSLTDEELAEALRDKQAVIAYYTPLGMEIGLNYSDSNSTGWVTVTYKDYEKYLMKF